VMAAPRAEAGQREANRGRILRDRHASETRRGREGCGRRRLRFAPLHFV
jgi:hypothetical protein